MALSKIPSSGIATGAIPNQPTFKNLVINGDMSIHQRVDAATANNKYGVDRFVYNDSNNFGQRAFSFEPNTDVPTGQGFAKCMKITMTTPETAIASGEYARVMHRIEAQNLQSLCYGTSSAKTVTLSFWLKTNVTGNFGVSLFQDDDSRIVGTTYTQASSGTWEKITVTFTGDTTGVIDNDNGSGLRVMFMLSAGSDFTSSDNTSWGAYANNKLGYGHTANLLGTSSGYWQVTGVQLEIGSSATDFEYLPHDVNLSRCQRYYYRQTGESGFSSGSAYLQDGVVKSYQYHSAPVPMRTQVSMSLSNTSGGVIQLDGGAADNITNIQESRAGVPYKDYTCLIITNGSSITDKCGVSIRINSSQYIEASAEL